MGKIETLSLAPPCPGSNAPVLYFLPGWWAKAADYAEVLQLFANEGFFTRSFSWRGTGQSDGDSFWGQGFEHDLIPVMKHFSDRNIVMVAHSGAIEPLRHALPILHRAGFDAIKGVALIAPLARSGAFPALLRFLRPDKSGTTIARWMRFFGSNVRGLSWFMRNELAIPRVLLSEASPMEDVLRVWSQIDNCPFGRYVLALLRTTPFLRYPNCPFSNFGVKHTLVLHSELDRNFSARQQEDTALAVGGEFDILRNGCHQWFADLHTLNLAVARILRWLNEKKLALF